MCSSSRTSPRGPQWPRGVSAGTKCTWGFGLWAAGAPRPGAARGSGLSSKPPAREPPCLHPRGTGSSPLPTPAAHEPRATRARGRGVGLKLQTVSSASSASVRLCLQTMAPVWSKALAKSIQGKENILQSAGPPETSCGEVPTSRSVPADRRPGRAAHHLRSVRAGWGPALRHCARAPPSITQCWPLEKPIDKCARRPASSRPLPRPPSPWPEFLASGLPLR